MFGRGSQKELQGEVNMWQFFDKSVIEINSWTGK